MDANGHICELCPLCFLLSLIHLIINSKKAFHWSQKKALKKIEFYLDAIDMVMDQWIACILFVSILISEFQASYREIWLCYVI